MTRPARIKARDRDALIQSLRAGVVPRTGQHLIQVGRAPELHALLADIGRISDGGSAVRFVIGDYGSGKTFFLNLVRAVAAQKKLVTLHADLNPGRRLASTGGQARGLYTELMRNTGTQTRADGALSAVVERFVTQAMDTAREQGTTPSKVIRARLDELTELVGGYDFATVIDAYWRGHDTDDDALQAHAVRWLRGEYSTRTEAKSDLGVRTIVDDASFYDQLKLLARFVRLAGYQGLLVCLDEMVNLYKIAHKGAREANYEQILRIVNDVLQGNAEGLGFVFGGTPDFLTDSRRGLYSYGALASRLGENRFSTSDLVDYSGPVLRLEQLTPEDFHVLLENVRHVYASGDPAKYLVPDQAVDAFMAHCRRQIGDAYFRTPRNTIKAFCDLLSLLEQNPGRDWQEVLGHTAVVVEENPDLTPLEDDDDDLVSF
ncbi:ATP-binding protein [Pseudonocardia alni]|uniref:ATP-binding protein n=1 Tax=Pseudonocardia alni TaxID=33907 RepID=UPI00280C28C3|nr:ATP-binding protein [Pseudonocardia alni]